MSDYYHASKMEECIKCGGGDASRNKYKFRCEDCNFAFP